MKLWKRIAGLFGMALGASAIWLAASVQHVFSSLAIFSWGSWKDYAFVSLLAALGVALIFVAYDFGFRRHDA
jgi:hypothetical protein